MTRSTPSSADDWRDDPSADERWNAGVDLVMKSLCDYLGVDQNDVTWDAATETVDGDISAVIGNILRTKFGEDWSPKSSQASELERAQKRIEELEEWKAAIVGKCKASDGFDAMEWGGDKEGWGFIHYFIGHLETRALHAETVLAEQDAARAALTAGAR